MPARKKISSTWKEHEAPQPMREVQREGEGKEGTEGICGTLQAFVVTLHGLAVG
jgi:hypothetical protein